MHELLTFNNELTMSSREITALTGKKHYNVMRDIENLAAQLEVDVSKFKHIYTDSQNREQTEYLLDKDTCLCLVAGYDAKQRMKIIKRWKELEQGKTKLLPQTKLEALLEALKAYVAEIEAHEKELAKKDNGKSIHGASIKQVNNTTGDCYSWRPLAKWCDENAIEPQTIYLNGYDSLLTKMYPSEAWLDVYELDLDLLFGD